MMYHEYRTNTLWLKVYIILDTLVEQRQQCIVLTSTMHRGEITFREKGVHSPTEGFIKMYLNGRQRSELLSKKGDLKV